MYRKRMEKGDRKGQKPRFRRLKRKCVFCTQRMPQIDYKDGDLLRQFTTEKGKILARRLTGNCARHQRLLNRAVKRARYIALLPFVGE